MSAGSPERPHPRGVAGACDRTSVSRRRGVPRFIDNDNPAPAGLLFAPRSRVEARTAAKGGRRVVLVPASFCLPNHNSVTRNVTNQPKKKETSGRNIF